MARVGIIFGGRSVEHKVSVQSARTVSQALQDAGHEVVAFGIAQDGNWVEENVSLAALSGEIDLIAGSDGRSRLTLDRLLNSTLEVVFPIVHGTWGEDGTLQGFLEILDLPYVGADVAASAVAMDKVTCKRLLQQSGVPVVDFRVLSRTQFEVDGSIELAFLDDLGLPLFVKPAIGGSSVGITRVDRADELGAALRLAFRFGEVALVEAAIQGRELECSVLGFENLEASAIGEIVPSENFYDYADKYLLDGAELVAPADLSPALADSIQQMATRAFGAINGTGMARVDFFLDDDEGIFVNEINTAPGFTNISMYPRLWEVSGLALPELADRLIEIALDRHRSRGRLSQEIDSWLEELEK
jgi:D-alanine-D-alanine ligase